jgi:Icc protein
MTTILQISDTHIVPQGALVSKRLDTAGPLVRLVERVIKIADQIGPIDAVLVSGDLTDDGSKESYNRFNQIMINALQCETLFLVNFQARGR